MTLLLPDGSPWDGIPREGRATATTKAATGIGVGFWNTGIPLESVIRTPQALMRRAQLAYHVNPWIGLAEGVVTRKVVGLPWHLEDDDDEEYEDTAPPDVEQAKLLLERPQFLIGNPKPATATRRLMTALTSRHLGLCGMTHWFADGVDTRGIPTAYLYINPARMWAAEDDQGNLTGWVLDAQDQSGRGGTPLPLEQVLTFYLDPPDWGHYGTGIYERAVLKSQITNLADQHSAYVIGTGGRIAGIVSPKEGTIPDEKFKALVSEFRNVNEAPDAAKRTTILQGPVDFTPTAADPTELNLVELAKMNRDDILAIWGVPPTQAAIPTPAGLNSGATKGFDEAILMQGAVHDRVLSIKETIQYGFLDKYLPVVIELEFEETDFDDRTPSFNLLSSSISAPLTNAERRDLVGLPPFGDPAIDNAILLPSTAIIWATAPGEGETTGVIEADVEPEPVEPAFTEAGEEAKASARSEFLGLRKSLDTRFVPAVRRSVQHALASQRATIVKRIRDKGAHLAKKPTDQRVWWNEEEERQRLTTAIRPHAAGIAETVTKRAAEVLDRPKKADNFEERVVAFVIKRGGERITDILETTREAVQRAITQGFADGLAPAQVADLIEESTAFNDARSEMIARTESMYAYNDAALNSYTEFGVGQVQAIDGDKDAECAARDNQVYSVDDAYGISDHPNGTLDWMPYFGKSSTWQPVAAIPQPQVKLVEPVQVNVLPAVAARPPMRLVFERDDYGKIQSIREEAV